MDQPFLNAYSRLLIRTCHRRGAFAMGGMAAFIPAKDPQENQQGSRHKFKTINHWKQKWSRRHLGRAPWFSQHGNGSVWQCVGERTNQLDVSREDDTPITANDLLAPCQGERTSKACATTFEWRCNTLKLGFQAMAVSLSTA